MTTAKKLPTKHRTEKTNKAQEEIIRMIQAAKGFPSYLEAKHEYFENPEECEQQYRSKFEIGTPQIETCASPAQEAESKPNVVKNHTPTKCMTISETKLGVTLVISKEECKLLGYPQNIPTKEALKGIRAKLGLPASKTKKEVA